MPFPSTEHQFQPGCKPGPGRPRKHAARIKGTPWLDIRLPGADVEACASHWVAMLRQGDLVALRRMILIADSMYPADVIVRAAIARAAIARCINKAKSADPAPQLGHQAEAIVHALGS